MTTRPQTMELILEYAQGAGDVSARRMFGEYALYCDGKVVGLICDDQLFVKPTNAAPSCLGDITYGTPYPGAKPWVLITGDQWEDADWLAALLRQTADALPAPAPKKKKTR